MKRIATPLLFAVLLAGCQSQPPAPTDKYYRLRSPSASAALARPVLPGMLVVRPLRAEGPLAERPMVFLHADKPLLLEQYHYQHWEAPPAVLVQEYLRQDLAARHAFGSIGERMDGDYVLEGRVLRFEKVITPQGSRAVAEIRLTLNRRHPAANLLERTYRADVPLADDTPHAFAQGMESAMGQVADGFARDLSGLR